MNFVAGGVRMRIRAVFSQIFAMIAGLALIFAAHSAAAADSSIAEQCEQWFSKNEYETAQVQSDELGGYLRFFYAQNQLYCHISYSLSGVSQIKNTAVSVDISNENRSYSVKFTANSSDDLPCGVTKYFSDATQFGQDIYFMLEFSDKEDKNAQNKAVIQVTVNDKNYYIAQVEPPKSETTSQAENQTSNGSAKEKAAAESTTKFTYSGGNSYSAISENTTKFRADSAGDSESSATQSDLQSQSDDGANGAEDGSVLSVPVEKEVSYSPQAKAMFVLAGIFAVTGVGFIIRHAVKSKSASADDTPAPPDENE